MENKWDRKYETGIVKLDEQHRNFFERLDHLELAIYSGKGSAELIKMLEFLESYIIDHFELEESLMLEAHYPDYAIHAVQHNEFHTSIRDLLDTLSVKGVDSYLAIEIDKRLRRWLLNHIMKTDMAMVPYIRTLTQ